MACVQNPEAHGDSEREEGEIVDELDDLSDISSEEEFLLRQRLHMLEKYNNVLERKNAKKTVAVGRNGKKGNTNDILCDLSEISATELEEPYVVSKNIRQQKHLKSYHKPKRRRPSTGNHLPKRIHREKSSKSKKKTTVVPESSDESDDEYRNKRRKLAHAVALTKTNVDKTSLKARLEKMLCVSHHPEPDKFITNIQNETSLLPIINEVSLEKILSPEATDEGEKNNIKNNLENVPCIYESVDLCSDKDSENNGSIVSVPSEGHDTVDAVQKVDEGNVIVNETQATRDSDEDLELLREHALKTKTVKTNHNKKETEKEIKNQKDIAEAKDALLLSGDEDSDTAELRLICLKSALLKKAFERKQKLKQRRKRMSQSCNLNDELMRDQIEYMNLLSDNNTDIESVDMDIGSDGDEKSKDSAIESLKPTITDYEKVHPNESEENNLMKLITPKEDEFEEDEDLLRAKLLTSLSKNLPNLVHPNVINNVKDSESKKDKETEKQANNMPEEKRFIISVGNSDSEGEHEATKNLTKMHMKLSEQADFQQKLDLFLKSTRMEVEKTVLPDVVQQPLVPPLPKTKEKFVPKTVKHLPKSEQIEYKNLVKRMAELEKIKNARQSSMNLVNKGTVQQKETLKPHNFSTRQPLTNNDLEEQIALSRKTIAEESAKVLKLKEEATKLSDKYKIVSTELRNIATAITFNKKQQKLAQIRLSKIRTQHQVLINSSTSKHSIPNGNLTMARGSQKQIYAASKRPQKENAPLKEDVKTVEYSSSTLSELQSVKVSVVNDRMEEQHPRLSVQIDVTSNKKTVKVPKSPEKNSFNLENKVESRITDGRSIDVIEELVDRGGKKDSKELISNWGSENKVNDDYKSPLQALGSANWDPNAVLCRFEVGGHCKDPDCKYLHPQ